MKQPVLLFFGGIALMSIIPYVGAQTSAESEECLYFTKIDTVQITATWDRTCDIFNNSTSFKVELFGVKDCTSLNFPCETDECSITIGDMDCSNGYPILPCSPVTYNVTGGNAIEDTISNSTHAAPMIAPDEWKLFVNNTGNQINVFWGPPKETNEYASCATKAKVTAECSEVTLTNITYVDPWNSEGNAVLDAIDCEDGNITVTVTYMSDDDVLTESKSTTIFPYVGPEIPTTDDGRGDGGDDLSGGVIAGIVIGSLLGVALIAGVGVVVMKKKSIGCFH